MTTDTQNSSAREIRERLGHELIDGDGHLVEIREAFVRFVSSRGGAHLLEEPSACGLMVPDQDLKRAPLLEERRRFHLRAQPRWFTTANTFDYAAVTMPGLMYERLPETGFDFSVVFPTYGLHLAHIEGEHSRRELCRLYNEMVAEDYAPYRDRLSPVAVLPLTTPEEGVEELEHAVSLGLKAFLIPSFVWRTIPAFVNAPVEYRSRLRRFDTYGLDSEYDYDPFWRRAVELNAPLAAHMSGSGLIDRISPTNYVYSAGHFAATGEALAKSLFLGGVIHRFPKLRVGLMEGGVAVGVRLYGDLVSRWEKRGPAGLRRLDLRNIDTSELSRLALSYHPRVAGLPADRLVPFLGVEEGATNDFKLSGVDGPSDIRNQFCSSFFWGCEGDDPLVAVSFDPRVNPLGATIPAFVGSDIGHWDVPNFDHPLQEAYEQIEHGLLTKEQFKDFTSANAVRFYGGDRSDFFAGTAVEAAAEAIIENDKK
ncbi:MAG TPA: amidohydrolase family protein [Acidimicrobiales bacterium]|nr:amidohydrolase family protein [Acidimicrobiales bacterium]